MPRPGFPPTPESSADIHGQDGTHHLSALHLAFELPPAAIHDAARISPTDSKPKAESTSNFRPIYPMQAAESVKSRRRSSVTKAQPKEGAFTLPPPPTRSRRIIQMKPHVQKEGPDESELKEPKKAAAKGAAASSSGAKAEESKGTTTQGKKKNANGTTAAGRKIARKTAHSLIERRRRSKMNEEFAVLKGLIPACEGDMHKLAILQASIEYVRYLQDCVEKLKAQHEDTQTQSGTSQRPLPPIREFHPTFHSEDVDMSDSEAVSPTFAPQQDPASARHPSASPALHAQDARYRQQSISSVAGSADHHRQYRYSFSHSTTASPALPPQQQQQQQQQQHSHHGHPSGYLSTPGSALTSPALGPQNDLDHEAMSALLMLNNERRGSNVRGSGSGSQNGNAKSAADNGRGLSVRDLLSS